MAEGEFPFDLLHALGDVGVIAPSDAGLKAGVSSAIAREMHDASGQPRADARRTRRRPRLAWVVPVLSSVVAVAVAAVVVVSLSHDHSDLRYSSAAPGSVTARFAVLRRPQTGSDRLPDTVLREVSGQDEGRVLPGLSRLVATPAGDRVFLVVLTPRRTSGANTPSVDWGARLGDQLALVAVTGHRSVISQAVPASVIDRAVDLAVVSLPNRASPQDVATGTHVFLAPDGVARLRVAEVFADGRVLGVRSATVIHNTAVISGAIAQAPPSTTRRHTPLALRLAISWYTANGTAIATSNTAERAAAARSRAADRRQLIAQAQRARYRAPTNLLAHFAIFAHADRPPLKSASGLTISRPRLRSLPDILLEIGAQPGSKLDYAQTRKITTTSGVTLWVIPGLDGLCITASIPTPAFSTDDCSGSQALAEHGGAGASSGQTQYGIVPIGTTSILRTVGRSYRTVHPDDGIYATTPRTR
jgi:hypothetical protein